VCTVKIGGQSSTTDAITWAQYDVLELFVAGGGSLPTVVKWRVNGGATTTCAIGGTTTLGALSIASALDLLCSTTTLQFSAWVQTINAYRGTAAPTWAA
jgi:hypothetical protein